MLGVQFSLPLPQGVSVRSSTANAKLTTTPVITGDKLTWDIGQVAASGKVVLKIKMVASECTAPEKLNLFGQFTYTNAAGANTVDACLKKPVSCVV